MQGRRLDGSLDVRRVDASKISMEVSGKNASIVSSLERNLSAGSKKSNLSLSQREYSMTTFMRREQEA